MFIGSLLEELRSLALLNTRIGSQLALFTPTGAETTLDTYTASALTTHINNALRNLYTRFPMKEKELYLGCKPGVSRYFLNLSQVELGTEGQYILDSTYQDTVGAFVEDVYQVLKVTNESTGKVLSINSEANPNSVFTYNSAMVRVPNSISELSSILRVRYLALPTSGLTVEGALTGSGLVTAASPIATKLTEALPWKGFNAGTNLWSAADSYIPVPEQYIKAIAAYVCYKVLYQADTLVENTDAMFYQNMYENACRELAQEGAFNQMEDLDNKTNRIENAGW